MKRIIYRILVHVIASEIKACKIDECLDIKHCSCEKGLISNLVSERKDEVLNITEKSLDDKRKTCEKKVVLFTQIHQ